MVELITDHGCAAAFVGIDRPIEDLKEEYIGNTVWVAGNGCYGKVIDVKEPK